MKKIQKVCNGNEISRTLPVRQKLPKPSEYFLKNLNSLEDKKRALTSYIEIFDWYPDLQEFAKRMLQYKTFEELTNAIKKGIIGPFANRDEMKYLGELEKIDPEGANIVKVAFAAGYKKSEVYEYIKNVKIKNPILGIQLNSSFDENGDLSLDDLFAMALEEIAPKEFNTFSTITEEMLKLGEFKNSLFSNSDYRAHFKLNRHHDYRLHAKIGEVLGYTKEDILVFGFWHYLPEGICKKHDDNENNKGIEILDWGFVNDFYKNAKRWSLKSSETYIQSHVQ